MILKYEDESTPGSESWPFFYECTTLKTCVTRVPSVLFPLSACDSISTCLLCGCESGRRVCEVVQTEASPYTGNQSCYEYLCGRSFGAKTLELPRRKILNYY